MLMTGFESRCFASVYQLNEESSRGVIMLLVLRKLPETFSISQVTTLKPYLYYLLNHLCRSAEDLDLAP